MFIAGDGGKILKATLPLTGVGIEPAAISVSGVGICPNPATDKILVGNPHHLIGLHFRLKDMCGRVVAEKAISDKGDEISMISLAKGIYSYVVTTEDAEILAGRLEVQ